DARVKRYGLNQEDFPRVASLPSVINAIPSRETRKEARYLGTTTNIRLVGCTPDYFRVNHLAMSSGRFITDRDSDDLAMSVVIASDVAERLFRFETPLGKSIQIQGFFFRVAGVTRHRTASAAIGGSLSGQDYNKDVYLPLATLQAIFMPSGFDRQRTSGTTLYESVHLNQITLQVADPADVLTTAEGVREALRRNHPELRDVHVVVPMELLKQADQLRQIFNIVLGSIAGISLVVGGIGIMNIMLATVTERTREIGIRRAIGARQADITEQFLTETMVLSGTGGLVGVLLGLLTPLAFRGIREFVNAYVLDGGTGLTNSELGRMFSQMEPSVPLWSLPLAFGFSVATGVIFGLYPARAAARLDPIEALRHE
ncbi:MAG TPA: ABC transporter permease, partial [Planctomycetaceae bacterium]|nr:ABC transporter permease [Planctomycetaceae bacterium]